MILLDTCTLLWVAADQTRLTEVARTTLASHCGEIFVSSVSAYEIGVLNSAGDIQLPFEVLDWFQRALEFHDFREIPLTSEFAAAAAALPLLHTDVFDRLLIGTAMVRNIRILTPDSSIAQYPQAQAVF